MTTWDQAEQVTITHRHDPRLVRDHYTVDKAPAVVEISRGLLVKAERYNAHAADWREEGPIAIDWGERLVRWRFENCRCVYRIVDYHDARDTYLCERMAAMGDA